MKTIFLVFCTVLVLCSTAYVKPPNISKTVTEVELNITFPQVSYLYDADIGFYLLCDTLGGKTKKCPMILNQKSNKEGDPLMVACQTAFSPIRGLLQQGCTTVAASDMNAMCTVDACGSHARVRDIHLCCCLGHRCNSNYYVRTDVEDNIL